METKAFIYMGRTPEETTKKFEEQARVQKEQSDMLHAQQQSIDDLKQMITLLIRKKMKKAKTKASSSKGKG